MLQCFFKILLYAMAAGSVHCCVLKCSSDLCSWSSDSWTALHHCAVHGGLEACQLLIAAKADVNAKTTCAFMFEIRF